MRVVPNESQLTGPFMVETIIGFDFLVWGRAAPDAAIPVREARQKRAEPVKQPEVKARRDIALEAGDSDLSESEVIR
jgi:hypothetical protein